MQASRYFLKTSVGRATSAALAVTIAYIIWLFTADYDQGTEQWVSAFSLNLTYGLFIYFGTKMLRQYPMNSRLRRSWILLIAGTVSIFIADFIFILSGRPSLSAAEFFYFGFYLMYTVGILSLPFVPISRSEKTLLSLDLGIVMLASLSLVWYSLIGFFQESLAAQNYAALSNMVYPALDFFILACAVTIIQRDVDGLHPAALLSIAFANGLAAIGDVFLLYGSVRPDDLRVSSSIFMVLRFFNLLAVNLQLVYLQNPGSGSVFAPVKRVFRIALPYIASAVLLSFLVLYLGTHPTMELQFRGALAGAFGLIVIVLYRQHLMLRENMDLYQQAKEAREEAEEATRAKADFLANMSHEIRTPLHGVIGMSELLFNTGLNQEQREIADTLRSSGNSLLSVINDVLDFSKIESGRLELQTAPFDLRQCIQEAFDPVRAEAAKKGLKLSASIEPSVPASIVGDSPRVRAIILNLLSNAVKFTDKGEVELSARSRPNPNGDHEIQISVKDTGIGISEAMQQKLFQPFSQIDASPTRRYGGTGLGLAISKRLCELMSGRMWLESRVGSGTTFHFTFPARVSSPGTVEMRKEFQIDSGLAKRLPIRILVVDDNPVHQKVACLMLSQLGFQTDVAGNGREAYRAHLENKYDLLLMDLQMPEMDGLECTRRIRQNEPSDRKAVIIAMTASAVRGDREKCLEAGMNDILIKPALMEDLQNMILRWWNLPSASTPGGNASQGGTISMRIPILEQIPASARREVQDQLIQAYLSDSPERLRAIRKAATTADWESLRHEAHALKGASTVMGFTALADACAKLEQLASPGDEAQSEDLIQLIEREYEGVAKEMAALLSRP